MLLAAHELGDHELGLIGEHVVPNQVGEATGAEAEIGAAKAGTRPAMLMQHDARARMGDRLRFDPGPRRLWTFHARP